MRHTFRSFSPCGHVERKYPADIKKQFALPGVSTALGTALDALVNKCTTPIKDIEDKVKDNEEFIKKVRFVGVAMVFLGGLVGWGLNFFFGK